MSFWQQFNNTILWHVNFQYHFIFKMCKWSTINITTDEVNGLVVDSIWTEIAPRAILDERRTESEASYPILLANWNLKIAGFLPRLIGLNGYRKLNTGIPLIIHEHTPFSLSFFYDQNELSPTIWLNKPWWKIINSARRKTVTGSNVSLFISSNHVFSLTQKEKKGVKKLVRPFFQINQTLTRKILLIKWVG